MDVCRRLLRHLFILAEDGDIAPDRVIVIGLSEDATPAVDGKVQALTSKVHPGILPFTFQ